MDYTFKGTPGPWSYKETTAGKHKAVDRNGFSVATTPGYGKGCKIDAHLISAAPDLLEALKDCISHIKSVTGESDVPESAIRAIHKALNIQP